MAKCVGGLRKERKCVCSDRAIGVFPAIRIVKRSRVKKRVFGRLPISQVVVSVNSIEPGPTSANKQPPADLVRLPLIVKVDPKLV